MRSTADINLSWKDLEQKITSLAQTIENQLSWILRRSIEIYPEEDPDFNPESRGEQLEKIAKSREQQLFQFEKEVKSLKQIYVILNMCKAINVEHLRDAQTLTNEVLNLEKLVEKEAKYYNDSVSAVERSTVSDELKFKSSIIEDKEWEKHKFKIKKDQSRTLSLNLHRKFSLSHFGNFKHSNSAPEIKKNSQDNETLGKEKSISKNNLSCIEGVKYHH